MVLVVMALVVLLSGCGGCFFLVFVARCYSSVTTSSASTDDTYIHELINSVDDEDENKDNKDRKSDHGDEDEDDEDRKVDDNDDDSDDEDELASLTLENNLIQMTSVIDDNHDNNNRLPEDLLIEIFLRSSVNSLLRAKCVCKDWNRLISDATFINQHLCFQKHMRKDRLILQYINHESHDYNYTIVDDETQSSTTYHSILDHLSVPYYSLYMEGPINGLYCLFSGSDRIVLWNPALMEFNTLPLPPFHFFPHYKLIRGFSQMVFGVDPLTNDYKVFLIRIFDDMIRNAPVSYNQIIVYSISTNTWRFLDRPGDYSFYDGLFLNGTVYWWKSSDIVLAMDIGKETLRGIPCPVNFHYDSEKSWLCSTRISVYEDHLALLHREDISVDIWVMLEEGMWTKQFSIGPFPGILHVSVVGFCGSKGLALFFKVCESDDMYEPDSQMVLYDVSTHEMRNIGPKATGYGFKTCVYCESLVSIDGGTRYKGKPEILKMVSRFLNGDRCLELETRNYQLEAL